MEDTASADDLKRGYTMVNNETCAYRLFALVLYYMTHVSFNLLAILR